MNHAMCVCACARMQPCTCTRVCVMLTLCAFPSWLRAVFHTFADGNLIYHCGVCCNWAWSVCFVCLTVTSVWLACGRAIRLCAQGTLSPQPSSPRLHLDSSKLAISTDSCSAQFAGCSGCIPVWRNTGTGRGRREGCMCMPYVTAAATWWCWLTVVCVCSWASGRCKPCWWCITTFIPVSSHVMNEARDAGCTHGVAAAHLFTRQYAFFWLAACCLQRTGD